jgi:hypothetical protein
LLHTQPFRPFVVHVADGGRLLVKHEDFVALAPSGHEMILYRHDKPDDYQVVDVLLITRVELPTRNGARKSRSESISEGRKWPRPQTGSVAVEVDPGLNFGNSRRGDLSSVAPRRKAPTCINRGINPTAIFVASLRDGDFRIVLRDLIR